MSKETTKQKQYKIEGEAFEKIKKVHEESMEAIKKLIEIRNATHDHVWQLIHEAIPELEKNVTHVLNTDFIDLGFVIVTEKEPCDHGLPNSLLKTLKEHGLKVDEVTIVA